MNSGSRLIRVALVLAGWFLIAFDLSSGQELLNRIPVDGTFRDIVVAFQQQKLQWYQQHTKDQGPVRVQAEAFLQQVINRSSVVQLANYAKTPAENEIASGNIAISLGSNDPIVLSELAVLCMEGEDWKNAARLGEKLLAELPQSPYPISLRFETLATLERTYARTADVVKLKQTRQAILDELPILFFWYASHPEWLDIGFRTLARALEDIPFEPNSWEIALRNCEKTEGVEPWLLEMLRARFSRDLAWRERGVGYADKVTPEGWKKFEEHMKTAGKHYREAYRLYPDLPYSAERMIEVALSGHDTDSVEDWFQRATSAEFDFRLAYESKMWSLRPRWGGSHDQMLEFGYECVETERYDTKVPYQYVQAVYDVRSELETWQEVFQYEAVYDRAIRVLDEYIDLASQTPETSNAWRIECLSQKAGLAIKNEDWVLAAEAFDELGTDFSVAWARYFQISDRYERSRVYAYLEFQEELERVRELTKSPDFDLPSKQRINSSYLLLLKNCKDDRSRFYLQTWIDRSQLQIDFLSDKWVDLEFSPSFEQWYQGQGRWEYESPKSVIGSNLEADPSFYMNHLASFKGPLEVTLDIELIEKTSRYLDVGIRVGIPPRQDTGIIFFGEPLTGSVGNSVASRSLNYTVVPLKPKSLHVRVWDNDHYEFSINGHRNRFLPKPENVDLSKPIVGIGSLSWLPMTGKARMSNLRIKQLTTPPPPSMDDIDACLEYYRRAIELEPDKFDYHNDLGVALYRSEKFTEALKHFEIARKHIGDDPFIAFWIADALCENGQYANGFKAYESYIASSGKYVSAASLLKYSFFLSTVPDEKMRNSQRGLELATKAMKDKRLPDLPENDFWYACVLAEVGRFDEAMELLDKADRKTTSALLAPYLSTARDLLHQKKPYRHKPKS